MRRGVLYIGLVLSLAMVHPVHTCADAPREPVRLRMLGPEDMGGAWAEILRRFHDRYPGIRVRYISGPWSTDERQNMYIRSFLGGDPYELVYMDVTWTAKFAARGWLEPLDRWWDSREGADFIPAVLDAGRFRGHLYRVPVRSDVGVLYYRKDLIPRPPRTWSELAAICKRLARPPQRYCMVFQGMQYEGLVCNFFEHFWAAGGRDVARDVGPLTEALGFMRRLVERGWAPRSVLTFQEQHALEFFTQGRALFMRNWPYAWNLLQRTDSRVRGRVGISRLPAGPGGVSAGTLGGWGLGMARGIPNPDAAWTFIRFATSRESQKILHRRRGAVPSRRSLFFDPEILRTQPHYRDLLQILENARPRPVHPAYPRISDTIQKHVSAVLSGVETPATAARTISASVGSIRSGERLDWVRRLFHDVDLWRTVRNTTVFTAVSVPIEFLLGLFLALLANARLKGQRFLRLGLLVPWALPTAVMAMSWQWMFNNPFGVINDLLVRTGLLAAPLDWLSHPGYAMAAAIFADVWKTTPFVVIILLGGLQTIPEELRQSFALDGGGPGSMLWRLTLPMLLPFIRVALIFRIIHAAGIFDLIWVLTRGGPADATRTVAIYIYELAFRYDELGYALFLTGGFVGVLLLISIAIVRFTTLQYERVS